MEDYLDTGEMTAELNDSIKSLQLPNIFRTEKKEVHSIAACLACNTAAGTLIRARRRGAEKEQILDMLVKLCSWLNIEYEPICRGAIDIHAVCFTFILNLNSVRLHINHF